MPEFTITKWTQRCIDYEWVYRAWGLIQELRFSLEIPSLDIDIFCLKLTPRKTILYYVRCIQFLVTLFFLFESKLSAGVIGLYIYFFDIKLYHFIKIILY